MQNNSRHSNLNQRDLAHKEGLENPKKRQERNSSRVDLERLQYNQHHSASHNTSIPLDRIIFDFNPYLYWMEEQQEESNLQY